MILCSRCPAPAFLEVEPGFVACADCWIAVFARVTEQMKADFVSNSCGVGESRPDRNNRFDGGNVRPGKTPNEQDPAGVASSPQDSFTPYSNPPGVKPVTDGSLSPLDRSPAAFDDGIPNFLKRVRVA